MSQQIVKPSSRWPHVVAALLACATLVLILAGAIVTTTDSGMAFKDWMTSDGTFFLIYDWFSSEGDKFIEHGHRLLGALAGFLAIALVAVCFKFEDRPWVKKFSLVILAGVILQGILGGARVVFDERTLALIHGCTGPLFFSLTATMVVVTSRWWRENQPASLAVSNPLPRRTFQLACVCTFLAYTQLIVGAVVRHSPDLTTEIAATIFRLAVYFHVLLACLILGHVLLLAYRCLRSGLQKWGGISLMLLVAAQVLLGLGTWVVKYGMPVWATRFVGPWTVVNTKSDVTSASIITAHTVIGSLIFIVCLVITLRLGRQLRVLLPRVPVNESRVAEVAR